MIPFGGVDALADIYVVQLITARRFSISMPASRDGRGRGYVVEPSPSQIHEN